MRCFIKKFSVLLIIFIMLFSCSTISYADSARVFACSQVNTYLEHRIYASCGFEDLGYATTCSYGAVTKSSVMDWINASSDNYGFYICTIGSSGYFYDYYGNQITPSEISGNWHLVFLDSGSSAATTNFASAFKTYGYSNRAFLGWSAGVDAASSLEFNYYFWHDYVCETTIRLAAIYAASNVPGDGTTPIRFYGDENWQGYSWT